MQYEQVITKPRGAQPVLGRQEESKSDGYCNQSQEVKVTVSSEYLSRYQYRVIDKDQADAPPFTWLLVRDPSE